MPWKPWAHFRRGVSVIQTRERPSPALLHIDRWTRLPSPCQACGATQRDAPAVHVCARPFTSQIRAWDAINDLRRCDIHDDGRARARTLSRSAADFLTAIAPNRKAPMRGKALAVSQPNQGAVADDMRRPATRRRRVRTTGPSEGADSFGARWSVSFPFYFQ